MTTFYPLASDKKKNITKLCAFLPQDDINDYQTTTKCYYIKKVFMY